MESYISFDANKGFTLQAPLIAVFPNYSVKQLELGENVRVSFNKDDSVLWVESDLYTISFFVAPDSLVVSKFEKHV